MIECARRGGARSVVRSEARSPRRPIRLPSRFDEDCGIAG